MARQMKINGQAGQFMCKKELMGKAPNKSLYRPNIAILVI